MTPSITNEAVFTALRTFLLTIFDCEVRQGNQNLVPMPQGSYVLMTDMGKRASSTNSHVYSTDNSGQVEITTPTEYTIQLDFYGEDAADMCQTYLALIQDSYAYEKFPATVRPLYTTPPREIAMIDGEENYIARYTTDLHLQFNPVITTPADYAEELIIDINLANGKVIQ